MASAAPAVCRLCNRETLLTNHHLIPRKLHRRKHFQKHYSRACLQQTIAICRDCHKGLHNLYDEMQLGKSFNTLDKLQQDSQIKKHVDWVARQRTVF